MSEIVLASASPRRAEFIKLLGIENITIVPPNVPEDIPPDMSPGEIVCRLASNKAEAVAAKLAPSAPLIIAADTLVFLDGKPLEKPIDAGDAADMLRALSNRCHSVYTGITLRQNDKGLTCTEKTDVYFRELSDKEIAAYVATGEPMDKAGAYAAQGRGAIFVERIEGDFWNITGLPLCRLWMMLKEFGAV